MKCEQCDGVGCDELGADCVVCNGAGDVYQETCNCWFCCNVRGQEYTPPAEPAKADPVEQAADYTDDGEAPAPPPTPTDTVGSGFKITPDDQELYCTAKGTPAAALSMLLKAFEQTGKTTHTCDCGRVYLTALGLTTCPPCRGIK
jgi:hypothetical protein